MPEDVIYVKGTGGGPVRIYHTDRDCPYLRRATTVMTRDPDAQWPGHLRECAKCAGTIEHTTAPDRTDAVRPVCRSCEAELNPDGTCAFCERWAEVMGDA